jgi:hypothetical protein
MADKEKIAELLHDVCAKGFWRYSNGDDGHDMTAEDIADYLTENGVTIQRWIPVTERLPERMCQCVCRYVFAENDEYPFIKCCGILHWMKSHTFKTREAWGWESPTGCLYRNRPMRNKANEFN